MDNPTFIMGVAALVALLAVVGLAAWAMRKPRKDIIRETGMPYIQPYGRATRPAKGFYGSIPPYDMPAPAPSRTVAEGGTSQPVDPAKLTPVHKPGTTYGGERLDPPIRAYGGAPGGGKSNVHRLHSTPSMPPRRRSDDDRRESFGYVNQYNDPLSPMNPNGFLYESTSTPAPSPSYDPPACSPPPDSGSSGGIDFGSSSSGCSDGGW